MGRSENRTSTKRKTNTLRFLPPAHARVPAQRPLEKNMAAIAARASATSDKGRATPAAFHTSSASSLMSRPQSIAFMVSVELSSCFFRSSSSESDGLLSEEARSAHFMKFFIIGQISSLALVISPPAMALAIMPWILELKLFTHSWSSSTPPIAMSGTERERQRERVGERERGGGR